MNRGFLGGTFNPPHLGHIHAARAAMEQLGLDELYFIPTGEPPHKVLPEDTASAVQRLEMTRLAASGIPHAKALDLEIRREGPSYSVLTARELLEEDPEGELWLLCGTDMFLTLDQWYRADWLLENLHIAAYPRKPGEMPDLEEKAEVLRRRWNAQVELIRMEPMEVSSTDVRSALKRGSGSALLGDEIYAYILRNRLYGVLPDPEGLWRLVEPMLEEKRVPHVRGCREEAKKLALRWGADAEESERAAILHDVTKKMPAEEQLRLCAAYGIIPGRQRCEANRGKADREAQERNRSINELERSCAEMGQRKAAADMEERQLLDKLWDGYGLSRSAAQSQRMMLESSSRAQKRVGQLRREMTALGSPNLAAIEDFDRVNERYTYLDTQKNDLEKAKRELEEVLHTVTEEMKRIFADEFQAVAESFSQTFKELFGGGRGELVLEDPADILNCGIEIRVQPPGKSLRTLTLLSGGERAFVAIALYFAMLKVRPAPFCVLDEIESALDETNVGRFARYTRSMSGNTQFLVITHRRGSMEEADMLYGVTMQKGISQVLRVDLKEAVKNTEA